MSLSTSSFERAVPKAPWLKIWLFSLLLTAAALTGYETALRRHGYEPRLKMDNAAQWARARRSVRPNDPKQVVLIGASRMQQDVDPDALDEALPDYGPVAQLAIAGSRELPLLENIAEDERFKGLVVFSYMPHHMTDEFRFGEGVPVRDRARDYIAYFKTETPAQRMEARITDGLAARLAFPRSLETGLAPLLKSLRSGERKISDRYGKNGIRALPNRRIAADYDSEWGRKRREQVWDDDGLEDPIADEEVASYAAEFARLAGRIQSRGGRVVVVRMPSSGFWRQKERALYPREKAWDVLAASADAIFIHFEDYPELNKYTCGDASHLDGRDAPAFSKDLGRIISEKLKAGPGGAGR